LIGRYGQGGTGHDPTGRGGAKAYWSSFLLADPSEAYVLETSGRDWATERVVETLAISNRTTIPVFDAEHRHPRQPVADLVDPRWTSSTAVLARRPVTIESLAAHLRSHDTCAVEGWSVCMHATDAAGTSIEVTTASMIAELRHGEAPTAWVLVGHPCEHDYVRVAVGDEFALTSP
jgi:hypothetical protein